MKLFISQPMRDRTDEEILAAIRELDFSAKTGEGSRGETIHTNVSKAAEEKGE